MGDRSGARILVVDDQENWRDVLANLLNADGHLVDTAESFEEAAEALSSRAYNLAILDVRLVDENVFNVDGIRLLQMIRSEDLATFAIVLTGYPESIRDGILEELDADALILKVPPGRRFDSKGFRELVGELLRQREG